jgi:hypothetical protein
MEEQMNLVVLIKNIANEMDEVFPTLFFPKFPEVRLFWDGVIIIRLVIIVQRIVLDARRVEHMHHILCCQSQASREPFEAPAASVNGQPRWFQLGWILVKRAVQAAGALLQVRFDACLDRPACDFARLACGFGKGGAFGLDRFGRTHRMLYTLRVVQLLACGCDLTFAGAAGPWFVQHPFSTFCTDKRWSTYSGVPWSVSPFASVRMWISRCNFVPAAGLRSIR